MLQLALAKRFASAIRNILALPNLTPSSPVRIPDLRREEFEEAIGDALAWRRRQGRGQGQ
jgi:hypothetical protein